jgi:hypothetical protein
MKKETAYAISDFLASYGTTRIVFGVATATGIASWTTVVPVIVACVGISRLASEPVSRECRKIVDDFYDNY